MSKEKAYSLAIELSKKHETDAVVYSSTNGFYGAILLEQYDGSVFDILAQFCNGFVVE